MEKHRNKKNRIENRKCMYILYILIRMHGKKSKHTNKSTIKCTIRSFFFFFLFR